MPNNSPHIQTIGVSKQYGSNLVLDNVSISVDKGQFLTILGPSGCGKTTLLRIIAGLEDQCEGIVKIGGKDVSALSPAKRGIGIVFQSYALFPNLTAWENVAYALKHSSKKIKLSKARVDELMELVGLSSFTESYPAQLSGGQQQRVALARALALSPQLLLLDEPLSALDAKVRLHLRAEIKRLVKEVGITAIMVTHDQEEALSVSDMVVVMNKGKIVQCATPAELYENPASDFVASFIGSMNFINEAKRHEKGGFKTELCDKNLLSSVRDNLSNGTAPLLGIRPENIHFIDDSWQDSNCFKAKLTDMEYRGSYYRVKLELNSGIRKVSLAADWPSHLIAEKNLQTATPVDIYLPPEHLHAFAKEEQ